MTRKRRSLVPIDGYKHPSASAWSAGCGCEKCKTLRRRKAKLCKIYGSSKVPAGPVIAKVEQLVSEGYSRQAIAAAAGISSRTIFQATLVKRRTVWRTTSDPILALTRADVVRNSTPVSLVPAVGAARRLQALMRMGWRMSDMAANATEYHLINKVRTAPYLRIQAANFLRIQEMYDRLSMKVGPSNQNRTKAARFGYAPPLAWDEDTIDDPDADPDLGGPALTRRMRLHMRGYTDKELARDNHVGIADIVDWRRRHGLAENQPREGKAS